MKHFEVCAAVIIRKTDDGKTEIFTAKRPGPKPGKEPTETNYKWEFPGGKIETGETREQALVREIQEEFNSEIEVNKYIMTVEHEYKTFSITMHAFFCILKKGNLALKEHLDSKWLTVDNLTSLNWAAADVPIMLAVKKMKSKI